MTTFLVSIILTQFAVEAAVAYLLYKKRHQVKKAIQVFLGIDGLHDAIYDNFNYTGTQIKKIEKRLKFIRRDQKGGKKLKKSERDAEILALAKAGRLIDAVKLHREVHGTGLKEALDAVRALPVN